MGLNAHCCVKFLCADLRFGFLRLSTVKKCAQMLRSDHRELRNSKVKFMWWVVGGGMKDYRNKVGPCPYDKVLS